jgi:hypothetical protein
MIGLDGVGRPLHKHLVAEINTGTRAKLQQLAILNLKPKTTSQFSYEEKYLAREALSNQIYDTNAPATTRYYALSSYGSWMETDADLETVTHALTEPDLNIHSAALSNLAQPNTEYSNGLLLAYAGDAENPCITRIQAMEALEQLSLTEAQQAGLQQVHHTDCAQRYSQIQSLDDPIIRAEKMASLYDRS